MFRRSKWGPNYWRCRRAGIVANHSDVEIEPVNYLSRDVINLFIDLKPHAAKNSDFTAQARSQVRLILISDALNGEGWPSPKMAFMMKTRLATFSRIGWQLTVRLTDSRKWSRACIIRQRFVQSRGVVSLASEIACIAQRLRRDYFEFTRACDLLRD